MTFDFFASLTSISSILIGVLKPGCSFKLAHFDLLPTVKDECYKITRSRKMFFINIDFHTSWYRNQSYLQEKWPLTDKHMLFIFNSSALSWNVNIWYRIKDINVHTHTCFFLNSVFFFRVEMYFAHTDVPGFCSQHPTGPTQQVSVFKTCERFN